MPTSLDLDHPALVAARLLADSQGGVVSRRQIYAAGVPRWLLRREVRARRWVTVGDQAVCLHTGPMTQHGDHWAAVFLGGPRALLDGTSALVEHGLQRVEPATVRVSVPRGSRLRRTHAYDVRQTRRWDAADRHTGSGVPRVRVAVAAVHGALWARTDREATFLLHAVVQQGLLRPDHLGVELLRVRRDRRRLLLHSVVNDLLDGARSLGEADVARALRRRGLPAPSRQVLRRDAAGRYYLDLYWPEHHLVVEVDGIHHTWAENVVGDALRQNVLALHGDTVLRLPLLGLRLDPDAFLDQVEVALRSRGWTRAA